MLRLPIRVSRLVAKFSATSIAALPVTSAGQMRMATSNAPPPANESEDWMDFADDDFWFIDEMHEGRLESPEFLPAEERELLDREGIDGKKKQ